MNFSNETVDAIAKRVESAMRRVMLDNEYNCLKAALSSLTLADLMQVEEVRELVEASGKVIKRSSDATDANYNQPMMLVYEQDLDALMVAHDKFTEPKQ